MKEETVREKYTKLVVGEQMSQISGEDEYIRSQYEALITMHVSKVAATMTLAELRHTVENLELNARLTPSMYFTALVAATLIGVLAAVATTVIGVMAATAIIGVQP